MSDKIAEAPTLERNRQPQNLVRQVSHLAVRTDDMSAIVKFYESFLGLPMVYSLLEDEEPGSHEPTEYIHCFFQLADGDCIAFFQFREGVRGERHVVTPDAFERHLALRVETKEDVEYYRARAAELGVPGRIVDHDDFYSWYTVDPNGDVVELTWHKPSLAGALDPSKAHRLLNEWLAQQPAK